MEVMQVDREGVLLVIATGFALGFWGGFPGPAVNNSNFFTKYFLYQINQSKPFGILFHV